MDHDYWIPSCLSQELVHMGARQATQILFVCTDYAVYTSNNEVPYYHQLHFPGGCGHCGALRLINPPTLRDRGQV